MACRSCHIPGHIAKHCPSTLCYNCNSYGHMARDCRLSNPAQRSNNSSVPQSVFPYSTNSSTTIEEFSSYAPFDVTITVTKESASVDAWLRRYPAMVYGMDVEWRPNFRKGESNPPALLQLATQQVCLIVQILHMDNFPASLMDMLRDPRVELAGVGINEDAKKLKDDCGWPCEGLVDLSTLAKNCIPEAGLKTSLKALAKRVFNVDISKAVTLSDWEKYDLSPQQIKYAALDAWICSELHTAFTQGKVY